MECYLDNSATTRCFDSVADLMTRVMCLDYGNPSSMHRKGVQAEQYLRYAKDVFSGILKVDGKELFFTSGGTESDNWALKGAALRHGRGRLAVSAVEHPAVFESAKQLERLGYGLTVIPVDGECAVDMRAVEEACRDAFLVSVMTANNETGRIQPVREIARLCRSHGVLFHTDAVQAAGCLPLDVRELDVDMLSLSAHKFGGPKGFGVLYIKNGVRTEALFSGGEQERGRRGGTSDVAGAVGTAAALCEAVRCMSSESARVRGLKERFARRVLGGISGARLNGALDKESSLPGIVNFLFDGITGEELLFSLDLSGISASNGSACSAGSSEPSRTLVAMGVSPSEAKGAVRFSFGRANTEEDVSSAYDALFAAVNRLRER